MSFWSRVMKTFRAWIGIWLSSRNTRRMRIYSGSIFRTIHTIKGACGFLAFSVLEAITHQAETLLSQLRSGQRELTSALVSLILETVDATRKVLAAIEGSGKEGPQRLQTDRTLARAAELQVAAGDQPAPIAVAESRLAKTPLDPPKAAGAKKEAKGEIGGRATGRDDGTRPSAAADSNIRVGVGCWTN